MTTKIIDKSTNGKLLRLGTTKDDAKWHYIEDNMLEKAKQFKIGDEIEIQSEQKGGQWYLTFIGKIGETPPPLQKKKDEETIPPGGKKPFDTSTSVKQTAGHVVSRIMIGLQGMYNPDNALETFNKLYEGVHNKLTE